jgi:hypothetical protein
MLMLMTRAELVEDTGRYRGRRRDDDKQVYKQTADDLPKKANRMVDIGKKKMEGCQQDQCQ